MSAVDLAALLSKTRNAIVAVNRPDRSPQATPVWFLWDGEDFFITTVKESAKYRLIKQDPRISLVIDDDVELHQYVVAFGHAEIIEEDVQPIADRLRDKYVPEELREEWTKILFSPTRVIIKLHPERIITGPNMG